MFLRGRKLRIRRLATDAAEADQELAGLERASAAQRKFFADAVRELAVPVAAQRAILQEAIARNDPPGQLRPATSGQLNQVYVTLLELTDRQQQLIDELLTLATSQGPVAEPVPVELADIAYWVSDGLAPEARRAGIELRVSAGPACTPGDPVLLERLARNLLQNAVRYNMADGWVRVATGTQGDTVRLTVANTGPVVPTKQVSALFEPFCRLPETGPEVGTPGLGLSIVRSVAHAHGGEVSAAARDGGGLVVEVTLPAH